MLPQMQNKGCLLYFLIVALTFFEACGGDAAEIMMGREGEEDTSSSHMDSADASTNAPTTVTTPLNAMALVQENFCTGSYTKEAAKELTAKGELSCSTFPGVTNSYCCHPTEKLYFPYFEGVEYASLMGIDENCIPTEAHKRSCANSSDGNVVTGMHESLEGDPLCLVTKCDIATISVMCDQSLMNKMETIMAGRKSLNKVLPNGMVEDPRICYNRLLDKAKLYRTCERDFGRLSPDFNPATSNVAGLKACFMEKVSLELLLKQL